MITDNFADRLFAAVEDKCTRLCVGIDPRPGDLPAPVLETDDGDDSPARQVTAFCGRLISAVAEYAVAVKFQSAFFEQLGAAGIAAMQALAEIAKSYGMITIADIKRGDIGSTAEAYAAAYMTPSLDGLVFDAVTINPYFGTDGVLPFVDRAAQVGAGVFVVVRTSNPSASELQELELSDGRRFYEAVGELVKEWGSGLVGDSGYSAIGAVVGATAPDALRHLRQALPNQPLLVPGFGAQGAGPSEVVGAFDQNGLGAIVNSARAIIYAYKRPEYADEFGEERFEEAAAAAARQARDSINEVLGIRSPG